MAHRQQQQRQPSDAYARDLRGGKQVLKERDAAAKAAGTAAGEEQDLWVIEMMSLLDIVRLRNYSTLYSSREFNPLVSIDFVDLSLPTCLLPQIHNGEGFSW